MTEYQIEKPRNIHLKEIIHKVFIKFCPGDVEKLLQTEGRKDRQTDKAVTKCSPFREHNKNSRRKPDHWKDRRTDGHSDSHIYSK